MPILVQLHQNSDARADTRMSIESGLRGAIAGWVSGGGSVRDLRVQLLRVLATLEGIEP
jgi:hypothetical protein